MKKILSAITSFFALCLSSQSTLTIPSGSSIQADGNVGISEWADADSVILTVGTGKTCRIMFKHDCVNFNLAFVRNLESMNVRFPEILIDTDNGKTSAWQPDDWWFHVSATDCHYQGAYGNYANCSAVQSSWTGIPNITTGAPVTDSVEIQIPFSTIGISVSDTIGLSLLATNTFNAWNMWPAGSNRNIPSSWATATFAGCVTQTFEINKPHTKMYPNPVCDILKIVPALSCVSIEIFSVEGERLITLPVNSMQEVSVDMTHFGGGIYLVRETEAGGKVSVKKIVR